MIDQLSIAFWFIGGVIVGTIATYISMKQKPSLRREKP